MWAYPTGEHEPRKGDNMTNLTNNITLTINTLRRAGALTIQQITNISGLNYREASDVVTHLIAEGCMARKRGGRYHMTKAWKGA
mgnify:CR=1 FL=1